MNQSNANQYLPLIQALAEGKTIQYNRRSVEDAWVDLNNVSFVYAPTRYRIKPERIKKKMWYHPDSSKATGLYPVADNYITHENWVKSGWKIVEVEFDAP